MKNVVFALALVLFAGVQSKADEGMWLPQLLTALNENRMKSLGMKMSASDIYNVNKSSLKDAVVSFGGFCTGEIISDKGLVLTNHHCGFDAIQNHSTIDHNYIRDGFWAKANTDELPNEGLYVTFIVRIDDVTKAVLQGVSGKMPESERQSLVDKNARQLLGIAARESYQDVFIRPFFDGNKYYQFITETYRDIRLVGAPPNAIGNFGKDTDNWMWPRHTGDFSLFRIYAGKDNKPAPYSPANVPYVPKKSLSISISGMKEGDFTMVFGFPGRTTEYLPSEAVRQIVEVNDPAKILVRDKYLEIIDKHMRADEALKIQYASKYAGVSNAWKKWKGEVLGLTKTNAVQKKMDYEKSFINTLQTKPQLKVKYANVLQQLNEAYVKIKPYALARDYYLEATSKIELFTVISRLQALKGRRSQDNYSNLLAAEIAWQTSFFKEMNIDVDKEIFAAMLQLYLTKQDQTYTASYAKQQNDLYNNQPQQWANELYTKSLFAKKEKVLQALQKNPEEIFSALETDDAAKLVQEIATTYNEQVAKKLNGLQATINSLQRSYMQAQMEIVTNKKFYPDANSTLRVAFGNVSGYTPPGGKKYDYYTFLDGVIEKYKPGDYEFDVPQKLLDLYKKKDFGKYANANGKMPVCFIASNHTTGGNSGSPALDAYGNLVGLNFDRVWEGTMSDVNYDPSICRNIMVDIRYVLFIIDKFAGAGHLVKEMKLVQRGK